MIALETTQAVPLTIVEGGTIRIAGTRINLDSVLYLYHQGESAEQIQAAFPGLQLADIHTVIGYYLNHRAELDEYLRRQQVKAEEIRRQIEASGFSGNQAGLRERLLARWAEQQQAAEENEQP